MRKILTFALSVVLALAMMLCASALVLDTAEASKTLYESADYEGGNYIDVIIATATAE